MAAAKKRKVRQILPGYNLIEYGLLRSAEWLVNSFSPKTAAIIGRALGTLLFHLHSNRRKITLKNLDLAFQNSKTQAEKIQLAKESFQNLVLSLLEFFRIESFLKEAEKHFDFSGTEFLDQALAKGKGVVLVISHIGSWEYLAFLPYLRKYPCSVIGKPMKNPYLYRWVESLRRKTTLNHIDKNNAIRPILSELHQNHVVAILIDQWASADGLWLDFFGHPTSTTSIPARLAKKTGAALVPAYCFREDFGRYQICIKPEVPLDSDETNWEQNTTLELNQLLEKEILTHPGQWAWTHKRWKSFEHYQSLQRTAQPAV